MVSITEKKIKGNKYFYLSYSYRENGKVNLIEKMLGRNIPSELNSIKESFICEVVSRRWESIIEEIKQKYNVKLRNTSKFLNEKNIKNFGIKFTYNSNRIEGSTLTLRETALAINEKDIAINKPTRDINEAQNHMRCYEDMVLTNLELSMDLIIKWHKILFSHHYNKEILAGVIRKDQIFIAGSNFVPPPPQKVTPLLKELFKWYNKNKNVINPVLLSSITKFRFVTIHPFLDGNGRMSRLLMNFILNKNRYPMFNISAKIRKSYYKALEKAQLGFELERDEMRFVGWFFKNYINEFNKKI